MADNIDNAPFALAELTASMVWDRPDELPWAICHLPDVKVYFDAAAKSGDAVLCWIG